MWGIEIEGTGIPVDGGRYKHEVTEVFFVMNQRLLGTSMLRRTALGTLNWPRWSCSLCVVFATIALNSALIGAWPACPMLLGILLGFFKNILCV